MNRRRTMKKPAKKITKKAVKKTTKKATKKKFRREDIPGIVPRLRDMENPYELAKQLGVPLSRLRARQIPDEASRIPNEQVNTFYVG
jgi:hypothetical protein